MGRGPIPRGVHGRQRRGHARKSYLVREKGRWRWRWRQKEVSWVQRVGSERRQRLGFFLDGGVLAQLHYALAFLLHDMMPTRSCKSFFFGCPAVWTPLRPPRHYLFFCIFRSTSSAAAVTVFVVADAAGVAAGSVHRYALSW